MTGVANPPDGAPTGPSRRLGRVGVWLLVALVVVAVAAPLLAPYDPAARVAPPFAGPSLAHPLGADDVGHDILSQLVYGTRIALLVGVVAAFASTVVGALLGMLAGYRGGGVDATIMRTADVVLSLPFLPLMIVVGVFLGPGIGTEVLVISGVMWAATARELRAQVLTLRQREHVLAARAMGAGVPHAIRRHIAPSLAPLVAPQFVIAARRAILFEAALSFLGLGPGGSVSWGRMLYDAHARSAFLTDAWLWWVVPPGVAIATAVLAFALVGYAIEERSRPGRGRGRRVGRRRAGGVGRLVRDGRSSHRVAPRDGEGPALAIRGLTVVHEGAARPAVHAVDLRVAVGETVGVIGESGAGKSTVALAAVGLLRPPASITGGTVTAVGRDLSSCSARELRHLRGARVGFVPQAASGALDPVLRVGDQVSEAIALHHRLGRGRLRSRVLELLGEVGLPDSVADRYPHQLSGGMRQRAVIATAIAAGPAVLVADEPTSGLDVVTQAEIVALLERLRETHDLALLVVSHDLAMVSRLADRLVVMRRGVVLEQGPTAAVLADPQHDDTARLVAAVPRLRLPEEVST